VGALRKLFGPSRKAVWQQLADQLGATYVAGGFAKGDKVQARVDEWTVTLDTFVVATGHSAVPYTRMRAPYVNADGFRFTIYRKGVFTALGKLLGMEDVEVGFPEFDEAFVIKGTDEPKLRALFGNAAIRRLLTAQPAVHFQVRDDEGWFSTHFPEGVDELRFLVVGVVTDIDRLKQLYELFAEVLHHLCHVGSAYERDPNVAL
jgi:hypothetical protein